MHLSRKLSNFVLPMSKHLISEQRYTIYLDYASNVPKKVIAAKIGVHPSTVTRELRRNANRDGTYHYVVANKRCEERRRNTLGNHRKDPILWWQVEQMIVENNWSPRQISGVLAKEGIRICPQTIYNHIHADETGRLAKYLPHRLRYRRRMRKRRETKATNIPNRTSIRERPAEADGRRFGDFEMDLIVDGYRHAILTLVERSTNTLWMRKLPHGKRAVPIAETVARLLFPYRHVVRTITTDNGSEFAAHELITKRLRVKGKENVKVYFTDTFCGWQKGCIENTNKLIRRYIPKGTNFNTISDLKIKQIQNKLNNKPREKLNFETPLFCFSKHFD